MQTGRWASVMPEKLAEIFGLTDRFRAIPIVDPEEVHEVGLVVPDREPLSPLSEALIEEVRRLKRAS